MIMFIQTKLLTVIDIQISLLEAIWNRQRADNKEVRQKATILKKCLQGSMHTKSSPFCQETSPREDLHLHPQEKLSRFWEIMEILCRRKCRMRDLIGQRAVLWSKGVITSSLSQRDKIDKDRARTCPVQTCCLAVDPPRCCILERRNN